MESEQESEKIQFELLNIAKTDSKRIKSIKNNLQFIVWFIIISLILGVFIFITESRR